MSNRDIERLADRVISKYAKEGFWGEAENRFDFLREVGLDAGVEIVVLGLPPEKLGKIIASVESDQSLTTTEEIKKNVEFKGNADMYLVDLTAHFVACVIAKRYRSVLCKTVRLIPPKTKA